MAKYKVPMVGIRRDTVTVGPDGKKTVSSGKTRVSKAIPITADEFHGGAPPKKKKRKYGVKGGKIGPPSSGY